MSETHIARPPSGPAKETKHGPDHGPLRTSGAAMRECSRLEERLKSEFPTMRIDEVRAGLKNKNHHELRATAAVVMRSCKICPRDGKLLTDALALGEKNTSPETRKALESSLSAALINLKKERIEKFNQLKQEIIKTGTKEDLERLLVLGKKDGILSEKEYRQIHDILAKKGMESAAKAFNNCLYEKSEVLSRKYEAAAKSGTELTQAARSTERATSSETRTITQTPQVTSTSTQTQTDSALAFAKMLTSISESIASIHPPTETTMTQIMKEFGAAIGKEAEKTKKQEECQVQAKEKKEEVLIEELVRRYPNLHLSANDIQRKFAKLGQLPPEALEALAKRISRELHPESKAA